MVYCCSGVALVLDDSLSIAAVQLPLDVWWCGDITGVKIGNYSTLCSEGKKSISRALGTFLSLSLSLFLIDTEWYSAVL